MDLFERTFEPFVLGAALGAVAVLMQGFFIVGFGLYGAYGSYILLAFAFIIPGAILGGVSAVLLGNLGAKIFGEKYFRVVALSSSILIPSFALHVSFFSQDLGR